MDTVLITGCSSGIGEATALAFLEEGWRVYATARDRGDVEGLAAAGCETAALDVTDGERVTAVVDRVVDEAGRIDCLVNNAGYGQFGPLEDVPVDAVRRQFDVNVHGPHRLSRAVLPYMREQGGGTIVNLSSNLGRVAVPVGGAYSGSKFALEAMSDALRPEVSEFGVDVVVVEPGSTATNFHDRAREAVDSRADRSEEYGRLYRAFEDWRLITRDSPLAVDPDDVAAAVVHAASCTDPAPRYRVGALATLTEFARFVPDRWRDAFFRLGAKLSR